MHLRKIQAVIIMGRISILCSLLIRARLGERMLLSGGTLGSAGIPASKASPTVYGVTSNTTRLAIGRFLFT